MRWFALLLLGFTAVAANGEPSIFFSKSFPGSTTPYVEISVDRSGSAVFNDAPGGPDPIRFQLKAAETAAIFGLAAKVGNFSKPLESGLKVANMGKKTFRYEEGGTKNEVHFNYSRDPDAQLLLDWFERITETVQHLINLERTAKFDRLGVDPYSVEAGTPAQRMPGQVAERAKNQRVDTVMTLQREYAFARNERLAGTSVDVMIDSVTDKGAIGRTRADCPDIDQEVHISGRPPVVGSICRVHIDSADGYDLHGTLAKE